jgi:rod shape-determining protein MreD
VLVFSFSLLQSGLLYVIAHWLLGDPTYRLLPFLQLMGALGNTVVALPLFYLLDRFKTRD